VGFFSGFDDLNAHVSEALGSDHGIDLRDVDSGDEEFEMFHD
jgi:hypothetical protein